ncbi:MAG: metallophosphatase family protein [Coriobacteriaceae bacterium]|nr:metallophosphatase family protein [Coriobacteriaceae bacterium]
MARIGIISDTHGTLPDEVAQAFEGVDHIIHAGDIGAPEILWELETIAPTTAVLGNNDWRDYGPSVHDTAKPVIDGTRIFVSHMPGAAIRAAQTGDYHVAIHGHTHVPEDELRGSTRIICPGSAVSPRHGSDRCVAILAARDGIVRSLQFVVLASLKHQH